MASRLRATLRGQWWQSFLRSFRYCYQCGNKLKKSYVPEERARRLVCINCHQITYINPKVIAGLIPVLPNGDVILLRRDIEPALGKWTYPAGFQEMGESVEQAAVRETWEEVRVRVKPQKCLGLYSYPDAGVVTVVYVGAVLNRMKPKAGFEAQCVEVFNPRRLPWKELAFRSTHDALKD